jgi:hypothetical protein
MGKFSSDRSIKEQRGYTGKKAGTGFPVIKQTTTMVVMAHAVINKHCILSCRITGLCIPATGLIRWLHISVNDGP